MAIIVGRKEEKKKLDQILNSKEAVFLAVYGRRRVGKTYLIRQYLKDQIVFDFTGQKDEALSIQLQNFFNQYILQTKAQLHKEVPTTWSKAFLYLNEYLQNFRNKKQKLVVFFDEMPWMDGPRSKFLSALEYFWNQYGSTMSNLIFISCGSSSSWIKKNLLEATGGLYNRITHRIKLHAFSLSEVEEFFMQQNIQVPRNVILDLYMAIGGIPHYLKEIKETESAAKIINELCFEKDGLLYNEYEQLFHSLFKNADIHVKIIEALSSAHYGLTQEKLKQKTKLPQSSMSRALEDLISCDFILEQYPFQKSKKETLYRVIDPYTLFYNRFMISNKNKLKAGWTSFFVSQTYKTWCGYAFENVCYMHTDKIVQALGISGIASSIHSWYFKGNEDQPGAQIDMLIARADKCINICEVKYSQEPYALTKEEVKRISIKKSCFKAISKTKSLLLTTLITVDHPIKNINYLSEVNSSVVLDDLF